MTQPPDQATQVLDYAPVADPVDWAGRLRRIALMLVCGAVGAIVAFTLAPVWYTSICYVKLAAGSAATANMQTLAAAQAQHAAAIGGLGNLTAAASLTGLTPATISAHLQVKAIPQSKLIAVQYTDRDPTLATGVAGAVARSYCAKTNQVMVATAPAIGGVSGTPKVFALGGFVLGAVAGLLIPFARRSGPLPP